LDLIGAEPNVTGMRNENELCSLTNHNSLYSSLTNEYEFGAGLGKNTI
ncbi:7100_t:CDS:1, partial [Acaulospora morrowiae]